jgi:membrane-associated protein
MPGFHSGVSVDITRDGLNFFLHIDQYLGLLITYHEWVYVILFLIIFAETGLIFFPFLPGDSLLFLAGAFCATGDLHLSGLIALLLFAAIAGNTVNFSLGKLAGQKILQANSRWIDYKALKLTHDFYQQHGGKTLILARFVPIVRTFAPFVAGIGQMPASRFQLVNISGAAVWVISLVLAGYFFGNLPFIKDNLNVIVLVGMSAALVPTLLGIAWKLSTRKKPRPEISQV